MLSQIFQLRQPARSLWVLLIFCFLQSTAEAQQAQQSYRLIDSGAIPKIFAPGIISTPHSEWSTSFSPDGQTVYSSMGNVYWTIIYSHKNNGIWQKPEVISFSGRFKDTDPFVTPDGKRIFFISSRPYIPDSPVNVPQRTVHLWYADRISQDSWGIPHHLDSIINLTGISNYAPSVSAKGTLYYCSRREGLNGMQSFYTKWLGNRYDVPRQVIVPGAAEIQDPFIAPDESYLIFVDGSNLCISFHHNGTWSSAQKLSEEVNNGDSNGSPYVSADGKTLYYTSGRIKGFYKRDLNQHSLNYDQLLQENKSLFNSQGNILMIPIHLPTTQK